MDITIDSIVIKRIDTKSYGQFYLPQLEEINQFLKNHKILKLKPKCNTK
jgi:hypothetical protein